VHQFCRIGQLSIIGGCSKVVQDVLPFMLADGNPFSIEARTRSASNATGCRPKCNRAAAAYKILFREGLTVP
jgi:UDP-N-acetylglucosamine acyltransferase